MSRYAFVLTFGSVTVGKAFETSKLLGPSSRNLASNRMPFPHVPLFEAELDSAGLELAMLEVSSAVDGIRIQNPDGFKGSFREVRRASSDSDTVIWATSRTEALEKLHQWVADVVAPLRASDLDLPAEKMTPPEYAAWKRTGCPHVGTTYRPCMYLGTLASDPKRFRNQVQEHEWSEPTLAVVELGDKKQGKIIRKFEIAPFRISW